MVIFSFTILVYILRLKGGVISEKLYRHLKAQVKYWQMISAAEREKNIKLEKIIKSIEKKIYGLEKENK